MEVVVQFLDGDPDRPLVTGCVYNGDNAPPLKLPAHKTQSVIRTNSSPTSGGYNELRFEDHAGHEEIALRAQRDLNELVLRHHTLRVGEVGEVADAERNFFGGTHGGGGERKGGKKKRNEFHGREKEMVEEQRR
jgi:uncharacterized protein involved in type VI secretion and phage assembly